MILLADSGSTKTDWCLVDNGQVSLTVKTCGFNPFYQTEEDIAEELRTTLVPELPSNTVDDVFFYGAGCTRKKYHCCRGVKTRTEYRRTMRSGYRYARCSAQSVRT